MLRLVVAHVVAVVLVGWLLTAFNGGTSGERAESWHSA
jgi:hypothetical protein